MRFAAFPAAHLYFEGDQKLGNPKLHKISNPSPESRHCCGKPLDRQTILLIAPVPSHQAWVRLSSSSSTSPCTLASGKAGWDLRLSFISLGNSFDNVFLHHKHNCNNSRRHHHHHNHLHHLLPCFSSYSSVYGFKKWTLRPNQDWPSWLFPNANAEPVRFLQYSVAVCILATINPLTSGKRLHNNGIHYFLWEKSINCHFQ